MNTTTHSPEVVEAAELKWESDTEVIGICKFPCVKNKNGTGVLLTGQPGTEVQQLAALHNEAIDVLAAEVDRLKAERDNWKNKAFELVFERVKEQMTSQLPAAAVLNQIND